MKKFIFIAFRFLLKLDKIAYSRGFFHVLPAMLIMTACMYIASMIKMAKGLENGLLAIALYITVIFRYVKSGLGDSARLYLPLFDYSGSRFSYIILNSPYTCLQFRIVVVQHFVASNVAKYRAFSNAISLGNALLWRFSLR